MPHRAAGWENGQLCGWAPLVKHPAWATGPKNVIPASQAAVCDLITDNKRAWPSLPQGLMLPCQAPQGFVSHTTCTCQTCQTMLLAWALVVSHTALPALQWSWSPGPIVSVARYHISQSWDLQSCQFSRVCRPPSPCAPCRRELS